MPIPPAQRLNLSPTGLNFGNVLQGTSSAPQTILISSTGSGTANFYLTPDDPRFVCTPSGNQSLATGTNLTVSIVFNATSTIDTVSSQFIGFQGSPTFGAPFVLQATTVATGSHAWNVTPNPFDFGSLRIGATSSAQTFTITNNDPTLNLTINTIAEGVGITEFTVSGLALPTTLTPGQSKTFNVTCQAAFRGNVSYPNALVLTPAVGAPLNLSLAYEGFEIVPAFTLTGATQGVLFGLAGEWDEIFQNYVAQSLSSLSCEAAASFSKQMDFGNITEISATNRVFMRVDPLGAVTVNIQDTCILSNVVTTTSDIKSRTGTNDSYGISDTLIFDLQQNAEIHQYTISVLPNGGILSIIYLVPAYEGRGSIYERA